MNKKLLDNIKRYYGETLGGSGDLRTDACCTPAALPAHLGPLLADIHPEISARYYGCGLVAPDLLKGLRILDLGCGSGRDVYLLARLVGESGEVIGVDMTPEQLALAEKHRDYHRERYGYRHSNVHFVAGQIEHLDQLGLAPESFDLVISNCVINLCTDKSAVLAQAHALLRPGGEIYFSDVYADRRVPQALMQDPVLHGECLAGALYWNDFLHLARSAGFSDPRLVEDRPLHIGDAQIAAHIAPIRFFSATYRLFKLAGLEVDCEDYGQAVAYRGTLPGHAEGWKLDKHHWFTPGKIMPVCGNTYRMLHATRFRAHFDFYGDGSRHLGIFAGCGNGLPFTTGNDPDPATGGCGC